MNIRDTGSKFEASVSKKALELGEYVRNTENRLIDRLESFEDIISLEVGDTSLLRSRTLERDHNVRQLYLKIEGDNPTGTQKDRIGFAQVYDALRREFGTITLATCGNYGASMAMATQLAGIQCKIFIPKNYHTKRIEEMERAGAEIIRFGNTYEEAVIESSKVALENEWYDANPGGNNTSLQINAYSQIAFEIYDQLRDAPKYCAVPVSNGTLLAGVFRGFHNLYKRGKTSRIPKMIAGSSVFKNPIVYSFNKRLDKCVDLDPKQVHETKINEPLINWHSFDGDEALYALQQSDGLAFNVSDKKMKEMSTYLNKRESIKVLPASTAGLIGLLQQHSVEALENDRFVAILTAKT